MKVKLINIDERENYVAKLLMAAGVAEQDILHYLHPPASYLQDPSNLTSIAAASSLYLRVMRLEDPHIGIVVD